MISQGFILIHYTQLADGLRILVAVVFVIVNFYWGIVAQFVRPHYLNIGLNGSHGYTFYYPFHIVEGI